MPYLNVDLAYFTHRKTIRLVGLLGRGAEVLPIKLWSYCGMHHAENGKLTSYGPEEIETVAGWWGEKGRAVEAMLTVGFLEKDEGGNFQVRNWLEHAGHLAAFKKRAKTAAKKRWSKYASSIPKRVSKHSPSRGKARESQVGKDSSEGDHGGEKCLPEWLDPNLWGEYQAHRAAMPKKFHLTARAEELAIKQLGKWAAQGQDPNEIVRRSIINGWAGLFEIKSGGQNGKRPAEPKGFAAIREVLEAEGQS